MIFSRGQGSVTTDPAMSNILVAPPLTSQSSEFIGLLQRLEHEVRDLRQRVSDLERQNLELRQQVGYWKAMHTRAVERVHGLEAELVQARGEIRTLKDQLYGRTSEKAVAKDRSNHLDGEDDTPRSTTDRKRGQRRDRPGPGRRDYSHLPEVEEVHDPPQDQQACPECGAAFAPCGTEDSEQIEIEVKAYRRRIRRRRYRRTCTCERCPKTVIAPPPPKLIPKGLLGTSVWVEILIDKYHSHRPTERLLGQWQLWGLDLAGGTVSGGLERLEPLFQPLYDALLARNSQSIYAQADETRWMVFVDCEGKTGHQWWLWVFLGQDTTVFRLDPGRSHEVPEGHFADVAGMVLMVDRYSAYKAMAQVKQGDVVLAFCWAHVRRDFVKVGKGWDQHKAWALSWLRRIRGLYQFQHHRLTNPAKSAAFLAAELGVRETIAEMKTHAEIELADPKLGTPCRKALESLQEHWPGLTRFVNDLRIPLDNNASERQNRGPAVGRKNYYGSGALWSGRLAAMLFSWFATLRQHKINIRTWLTWVLQSCAENSGQVPTEIDRFLPWNMPEETRRAMALDPDDTS